MDVYYVIIIVYMYWSISNFFLIKQVVIVVGGF